MGKKNTHIYCNGECDCTDILSVKVYVQMSIKGEGKWKGRNEKMEHIRLICSTNHVVNCQRLVQVSLKMVIWSVRMFFTLASASKARPPRARIYTYSKS
jgi:hypothetical protein